MTDVSPTVRGVWYFVTLCGSCTVWHVIFAVIVIARYRAWLEGGWKMALFGKATQ